jgi:hypothetical protein
VRVPSGIGHAASRNEARQGQTSPYLKDTGESAPAGAGRIGHELARNRHRILAYAKDRNRYIPNDTYPIGWSLLQLAQVLQARKSSEEEARAGVGKIVRSQYDATEGDINGQDARPP